MRYKKVYSKDLTSQEIRQKYLIAKYDEDVICDHCGSDQVYIQNEDKNTWRCKSCWKFFSLTSYTFLENTKLPLRFWYEVICCFVSGHSANKAHEILETAHHQQVMRPYQMIRKALLHYSKFMWKEERDIYEGFNKEYSEKFNKLIRCIVNVRKEEKERRARGVNARKYHGFLIYKRIKKRVFLGLIGDLTEDSLESIVEKIANKQSKAFTDPWKGYCKLWGLGYFNSKASYEEGEFVSGKIHCKLINGFLDLSNANMTTHKGIKKKNLNYFLKEMEFRYNHESCSIQEQVDEIIKILMKRFY